MAGVVGEKRERNQLDNSNLSAVGVDLDLFSDIPINVSHEWSRYTKLPTITNLQNDDLSSFEFVISPSNFYTDLKKCQLELFFKVLKVDGGVKSDVTYPADGDVAICNLPLHLLIERVEVLLGSSMEIVSDVDNYYGLRTYIEFLQHYGVSAKKSHLTLSGFYPDAAGKFNTISNENKGHKQRRELFTTGKECSVRGYLNCGIFRQQKLLLSQCPFRIKIYLKPPNYVLLGNVAQGKTHNYTYKINQAFFHVCHVGVSDNIALAHETTLAKGFNAIYNLTHPMVTHHTITSGNSIYNYQDLFSGQIPALVYIIFQDSDAFNGDITKNCLELKHFNLQRLQISVDGQSYPAQNMQFDFDNDDFMDGLNSVFCANGIFNKDIGLSEFDRKSYKDGYSIFCFDLSLNGYGAKSSIRDPSKIGNCAIDLAFKSALTSPVVVTIVGYIKTSLQITKHREIIKFFR